MISDHPQKMVDYHIRKYEKFISDWLSGKKSGTVNCGKPRVYIRKYLLNKYKEKCQDCKWSGKNIRTGSSVLQVHHCDGNRQNNDINNLRLLCPNCHSLTKNFGPNKIILASHNSMVE